MPCLRTSIVALLVSGSAAIFGCGVGEATGPGDDVGEGDQGEDGADGDEGGADAGAAEPDAATGGGEIERCATAYVVTGSVNHGQEPQGTCEGSGLWEVNVSAPAAGDSGACAVAPATAAFRFTVVLGGDDYSAVDNDDGGRTWTVQIRDKSGSCSATFSHEVGDSEWALIAAEQGPGGPLDGTAHYRERGP